MHKELAERFHEWINDAPLLPFVELKRIAHSILIQDKRIETIKIPFVGAVSKEVAEGHPIFEAFKIDFSLDSESKRLVADNNLIVNPDKSSISKDPEVDSYINHWKQIMKIINEEQAIEKGYKRSRIRYPGVSIELYSMPHYEACRSLIIYYFVENDGNAAGGITSFVNIYDRKEDNEKQEKFPFNIHDN